MLVISLISLIEFKVYRWFNDNYLAPSAEEEEQSPLAGGQGAWKERREAEESVQKYLADFPSKHCYHARKASDLTSSNRRHCGVHTRPSGQWEVTDAFSAPQG